MSAATPATGPATDSVTGPATAPAATVRSCEPGPDRCPRNPCPCQGPDDHRDRFRQHWRDLGLTYKGIRIHHLELLLRRLQEHLPPGDLELRVCPEYHAEYGPNGLIRAAFWVDGSYFQRRECITFNADGWIGVAGWASTKNANLIVPVLCRWAREIAQDSSVSART